MTVKAYRINPYIAGRALGQERGFFGREDILRLVETSLGTPDQNALVLFGQRRIGKTSILLQLRHRLPTPPFLPIYFDLMDRARQPLGQVLFEIASTIAGETGIVLPASDQFDDQGIYFHQSFLSELYKAIGEGIRPVLLFDEFDVLDVIDEYNLLPVSAARTFFPYLRKLMQIDFRIGFVFVIGRRTEDLSSNVKATFKSALYQRVSVLDMLSAQRLITTAERQETLMFDALAVDQILKLTAGHPYFIQLICQILWNDIYTNTSLKKPQVDITAVDIAASKSLEIGYNVFEWIWDGLPPAERVIFAAIAEATDERAVVTEIEITELLQSYGVRVLISELELAPHTLVEWEMLRKIDGGYQFFIELMRRWVIHHKPLLRVKEELDRVVPLADRLYSSAEIFYQKHELNSAQGQLCTALRANPNHLRSRLFLGKILKEQGCLYEAVKEFEEAYQYDKIAARKPLIHALISYGEDLERWGSIDKSLEIYNQILDISPNEKEIKKRREKILLKQGDDAVIGNYLEEALILYQQTGLSREYAQIRIERLYDEFNRKYKREKNNPANRIKLTRSIFNELVDTSKVYKDNNKNLKLFFNSSFWIMSGFISLVLLISYYFYPFLLNTPCMTFDNCFTSGNEKLGYYDYNGAIADFNMAIDLNPEYSEAYFRRGMAFAGLRTDVGFEKALEDFERVININPGYIDIYINRGIVYNDKYEYQKAIRDFNKAISIDNKNAIAYFYRGNSYLGESIKNINLVERNRFLAIKDYNMVLELTNKDDILYVQAVKLLYELDIK